LRFGEAIELRRKDFEYIAESDEPVAMNVARGVTHRSGGDPLSRCRIDTPKSGKGRKVAIPPHIRADVQTHLDTFVDIEPDSLCSFLFAVGVTSLIALRVMLSGPRALPLV
jgi:hypothetical protein